MTSPGSSDIGPMDKLKEFNGKVFSHSLLWKGFEQDVDAYSVEGKSFPSLNCNPRLRVIVSVDKQEHYLSFCNAKWKQYCFEIGGSISICKVSADDFDKMTIKDVFEQVFADLIFYNYFLKKEGDKISADLKTKLQSFANKWKGKFVVKTITEPKLFVFYSHASLIGTVTAKLTAEEFESFMMELNAIQKEVSALFDKLKDSAYIDHTSPCGVVVRPAIDACKIGSTKSYTKAEVEKILIQYKSDGSPDNGSYEYEQDKIYPKSLSTM